jgi:excisionase family DNA binding protein
MGEILTAKEVGAMLKLSTRQVYELAKDSVNPLPSLRIRTSVRFRRADLEGWIAGLIEKKAA